MSLLPKIHRTGQTTTPPQGIARLRPMRLAALAALAALAFSRAGGTQLALLADADERDGDLAVVETALTAQPPILHTADLAGA